MPPRTSQQLGVLETLLVAFETNRLLDGDRFGGHQWDLGVRRTRRKRFAGEKLGDGDTQLRADEEQPDDEQPYYPVWDLPEPAQRRFPTLAKHSLHTGYLLPVPFEGVYKVEPFEAFGHWDTHHASSSSQTLSREADSLLASLVELQTSGGSPEHMKYMENTQILTNVLRDVCRLSVEHGVPVIFYG